jgi:hypothetical protein
MDTEHPKHCEDCGKLETCKQKVNMLADTQPVGGFIADIADCEIYCEDCLRPDDRREPYHGETDCPQHCTGCGVPIDCGLTQDGVEYIKEAIAGGAGCCQELWPELFRAYL